jgi:ketosteroid isomerase-like protein
MLSKEKLIELVLTSYQAEKEGDVNENKKLLHENFEVVDMVYETEAAFFPRLQGEQLDALMTSAFKIKGRQFEFKTVIADEQQQKVVVEFVESFPDPKTGNIYRTPQVSICIVRDGKIFRTRHYMDPRLSFAFLSTETIENAFV